MTVAQPKSFTRDGTQRYQWTNHHLIGAQQLYPFCISHENVSTPLDPLLSGGLFNMHTQTHPMHTPCCTFCHSTNIFFHIHECVHVWYSLMCAFVLLFVLVLCCKAMALMGKTPIRIFKPTARRCWCVAALLLWHMSAVWRRGILYPRWCACEYVKCGFVFAFVRVCACVCVCVRVRKRVCVCAFVCLCACLRACMYVFVYENVSLCLLARLCACMYDYHTAVAY